LNDAVVRFWMPAVEVTPEAMIESVSTAGAGTSRTVPGLMPLGAVNAAACESRTDPAATLLRMSQSNPSAGMPARASAGALLYEVWLIV